MAVCEAAECTNELVNRQRRFCSRACRQRVRRHENPGSGQGTNRAYWRRRLAAALQVEESRRYVHQAAVRVPPTLEWMTDVLKPLAAARRDATDEVERIVAKLAEIDPPNSSEPIRGDGIGVGAELYRVHEALKAKAKAESDLAEAEERRQSNAVKREAAAKLKRARDELERVDQRLVKARRLRELAIGD